MSRKHNSSIVAVEWREREGAQSLEVKRDHWLTVALDAESRGMYELQDMALQAAEETETKIHSLRMQV